MISNHQKNRVYSFFEWWIGTALIHYFDEIEVRGLENIPRNVPVIFTPNHENALLDPLLVILNCPYQPFSVARSDVFKDGPVGRFLNYIRMYPAYRPRDGREKMARNEGIFEELANRLRHGNSVLIFPEGDQQMERRLRPLVKGTFRFAFSAFEGMDENFELMIVPVGITYADQIKSGYPAAIQFGPPIAISKYRELYATQPPVAINKLRNETWAGMEPLMMHIPEREKYAQVEFLRRIQGVRQALRLGLKSPSFLQQWEWGRALVNRVVAPENPRHHWSMPLEPLQFYASKYKVAPEVVASYDQPAHTWTRLLLLILFAPLGLVSGLFQAVPYAVKRVVMRKVTDPHFQATAKFGAGLLLYPLWAIHIFAGLSLMFGPLIGATAAFALPSTFKFYRNYARSWTKWLEIVRFRRHLNQPIKSELNNSFHQINQALRGSM